MSPIPLVLKLSRPMPCGNQEMIWCIKLSFLALFLEGTVEPLQFTKIIQLLVEFLNRIDQRQDRNFVHGGTPVTVSHIRATRPSPQYSRWYIEAGKVPQVMSCDPTSGGKTNSVFKTDVFCGIMESLSHHKVETADTHDARQFRNSRLFLHSLQYIGNP